MSNIAIPTQAAQQMLSRLQDMQHEAQASIKAEAGSNNKSSSSGTSFFDQLKGGITEVNDLQRDSDKMSVDLASGKNGNLHETMLAVSTAELAFNLMVQVRNRALEAYQEVMRMQV